MKPRDKKKYAFWSLGLLFGALFFLLLGIRLDFFAFKAPDNHQPAFKLPEKESWMNILRHDQKIGYSHRLLTQQGSGYRLSDKTYLRINVMGMVQDMLIRTTGDLNADFSLASFSFNLDSGLFNFYVHGKVEGKTLHVFIDEQEMKYPLDQPLYLFSGILDAVWLKTLTPGETKTIYVFDPATMGRQTAHITMEGYETLNISGKSIQSMKFSIKYMGISQMAWTDETGDVVQEKGLMGIKLVRSTKKSALAGFDITEIEDLTESISVASNIQIPDPSKLALLRMNIYGVDDTFLLHGGRQTFEDNMLTIIKEALFEPTDRHAPLEDRFLNPSPGIQSGHAKIIQKVSEIISPKDLPLTKAKKIMSWIYENIEKRPVLSVPNALETLENRMGDCNEHAVLFSAMARAAGIPAQVETGLVYMKGRFYYHAWNVLYLNKWITADALMGQMPADVTHIRLIRGEMMDQLDLIHAIDKVKLKILEPANDSTH